MASKQQKQIVAIGIGLVILVGALINSYMTIQKKEKGKKKPPVASEETAKEIVKQAQTQVKSAADDAPLPLSQRPTKTALKKQAFEDQKRITEGEWGPDPFYHEAEKKPENGTAQTTIQRPKHLQDIKDKIDSELNFTGISRIGSAFIAVINRKMLRVGDKFSLEETEILIKDIQKDRVIIEANGGEYELKLKR